jgi:hypothetical protein
MTEPALSNVWWSFNVHGRRALVFEKALALWLNSTPGLLLMLGFREETQGCWVDFKKPILEGLPVLDAGTLRPAALRNLAAVFDELAAETFLPFPLMAEDRVRALIDTAVSKALGAPEISAVREMLAVEPVVCGSSRGLLP